MLRDLSPAFRTPILLIGLLAWGLALYGATQLHQLDLPIGHGICGPWGCAAEPEALLGYHMLWATLLVPAAIIQCRALPPLKARRWSLIAIVFGLSGALALAAWASFVWTSDGHEARFALQRGLFIVATTPDLPLIPLFLAGLAGLVSTPCGSKLQSPVSERSAH